MRTSPPPAVREWIATLFGWPNAGEETATANDGAESRYYASDTPGNPLGRRAFLDHAKRGSFPSFRPGKKVLALKSDVHAWIESQRYVPPAPVSRTAPVDEDAEAERQALGPRRLRRVGP